MDNREGFTPFDLIFLNKTGEIDYTKDINQEEKAIAALLINNQADIDVVGTKSGVPILHDLIYGEHYELAMLAIANGADITITDNEENTPLHIAARLGIVPVVETLLSKGVSFNSQNNEGLEPIELAKKAKAEGEGTEAKDYDRIVRLINKINLNFQHPHNSRHSLGAITNRLAGLAIGKHVSNRITWPAER